MKRGAILIVLGIILISLNLLSASYRVGNLSHVITTSYAQGDFISGWVNMSFDHEPMNSLFGTNLGDSISLIDLMSANFEANDYDFFCIPENCQSSLGIVANSGELGKTFLLTAGEERAFGIKLTGTSGAGIAVTEFSMDVSSNATDSNVEQLSIDVLNDEEKVWKSSSASGKFRTRNFGCYSSPPAGTTEATTPITTDEYCESINLQVAPNVMLSAGVIADTGAAEQTFTLNIKNQEGTIIGSCQATTSVSEEISCIAKKAGGTINLTTEQKTYSVCLKGSSANTKYLINLEERTPVCGLANGVAFDFNISARAGIFGPVGGLTINKTTVTNIEADTATYLLENYGVSCPATGCVIPIKFISKVNQEVTLSNAVLLYTAGVPKTENTIHNLTGTPAVVNASMQKLYLDYAEFSTPTSSREFSLNYSNNKIFSENINMQALAAISLNPTTTIAGYPTNFSIRFEDSTFVNKSVNYTWDFGDETVLTGTKKSMIHTYASVGTFELVVEIRFKNITASKNFQIEVKNPKEAVNVILSQRIRNFNNITATIKTFPIFYQEALNATLDLENIEIQLDDLKALNASAETDEDYIEIMTALTELEIPSNIKATSKAQGLSFFADVDKIDLDMLKTIKSFTLRGSEEDYTNSIMAWNLENMDTKVSVEKISALYGDYSQPVLNVVIIDAKKKAGLNYNPYLIIQKADIISFMGNYPFEETDDYYYLELEDSETRIGFSTLEDLDFTSLPVFISPVLEKLSIINIAEEEKPKTWILILSLGLLAVFGILVFLLMRNWYKKRYEDFLFKNKNDLYNLVAYIQNSKKAGIKDREIADKLKKAGWKTEQVNYVMKKYKKMPGNAL